MAYPDVHKIEEIFQLRDSWATIPKYREYLASNLIGHVSGFDHELSGNYRGKDDWVQNVEMRVGKVLKKDHPINLEIVHVTGGGDSPWACVEMKSRTKSHAGELFMLSCKLVQRYTDQLVASAEKDFGHEFCYVIKFNPEGKIIKIRAYFDSSHTDSHLKENEAK